jgi:hypothetical protein
VEEDDVTTQWLSNLAELFLQEYVEYLASHGLQVVFRGGKEKGEGGTVFSISQTQAIVIGRVFLVKVGREKKTPFEKKTKKKRNNKKKKIGDESHRC